MDTSKIKSERPEHAPLILCGELLKFYIGMLGKMRQALCVAVSVSLLFAQKTDPDELFHRAVDAQQAGDYPAAIQCYKQLLSLRPDFFEARANLGAALVHEKKFDQAVAEYQAALKLHAGDPAIVRNLGLAFYKEGDFRRAADQFTVLHTSAPEDLRIVTLLADCDERLGQDEQAVALLAPLEKSNPDNLDLIYVLGSALIHSGKREAGVRLVDRVARQSDSADAYLLAGSTWIDLNEFDKAREDLDAALRLNPNLPGVHTFSGIVRDKVGDAQGGEAELRKALQLDPNDFQANLNLGAILYKQRDAASAKVYLTRAAARNPASPLVRYELALVKSATGDLSAAAQDLEMLTRENPSWLEPHVELAALYYKLRRPADGLKEREIVDRLTGEQQKQEPEPKR